MLTLLVLAPSFAFSAAAVSAQIDPPTVRQSRNGEFMTKYYPPTARSRGEQGKVGFQIGVDRDGFLTSCEITQTSGFKNLDRETCDFLVKYAKIKPMRDSDGRAISASQQGYMNWRLPPGSRKVAMVDSATSLDPDKLVCRRFPRTGSKVGMVKQCMTRQEWANQDQRARDQVTRIQDQSEGCDNVSIPCTKAR